MFKVDEDNTIHLTRGDTARFSIGRIVNTVTNTNYTPTAGQSAYAAAQAGGYTDTQANFYADLAAMQGLASALAAI